MNTRSILIALPLLLATPFAAANGVKDGDALLGAPTVITSGGATVSWDSTVTGTAANCNFTNGGPDHCFQHFWLFRVDGDTQETQFPIPDSVNVVGTDALIANWADVGGRGLFSATLTMRVLDAGNGTAEWRQAMQIASLAPSAQQLRVFHYIDLDIEGTSGIDNAVLLHANDLIELSETNHMFYRGVGADRQEVIAWPGLRNVLLDASNTELANTQTPFGPGDFTGALQWNHTLQPAYPVRYEVVVGLNRPAMAQGSTVLNFDEVALPTGFASILPASTEYQASGVVFGLANGEGMGFLDVSNFSANGESPPNALAYNDNLLFQDGTGVGAGALMQPLFIAKRFEVRGNSNLPGNLSFGCLAADRGNMGAAFDHRDASLDAEHMVLDRVSGGLCAFSAPVGSAGFFDDLAFTPLGTWTFDSLSTTGCADGNISVNLTFGGHLNALPYVYETIARANGQTYMHQSFAPNSNLDGTLGWSIYDTDNGGPTDGVWPLPTGTPVEITLVLRNPEGGVDHIARATLSQCDGGTLGPAVTAFDSIFEDGIYGAGNQDSQ